MEWQEQSALELLFWLQLRLEMLRLMDQHLLVLLVWQQGWEQWHEEQLQCLWLEWQMLEQLYEEQSKCQEQGQLDVQLSQWLQQEQEQHLQEQWDEQLLKKWSQQEQEQHCLWQQLDEEQYQQQSEQEQYQQQSEQEQLNEEWLQQLWSELQSDEKSLLQEMQAEEQSQCLEQLLKLEQLDERQQEQSLCQCQWWKQEQLLLQQALSHQPIILESQEWISSLQLEQALLLFLVVIAVSWLKGSAMVQLSLLLLWLLEQYWSNSAKWPCLLLVLGLKSWLHSGQKLQEDCCLVLVMLQFCYLHLQSPQNHQFLQYSHFHQSHQHQHLLEQAPRLLPFRLQMPEWSKKFHSKLVHPNLQQIQAGRLQQLPIR